MSHRVAITGTALWCPLGSSPREVLRRLTRRESGIGPLTCIDGSRLGMAHAAEVRDFNARDFFTPAERRHFDRATQLALVVARRALVSAGLAPGATPPERFGLCVGASGAGQFQNVQFTPEGAPFQNRRAALYHSRTVPHFQAQVVASRYGLRGPQAAFGSASTGSALAIIQACQWIRAGKASVMLAGGSEMLTVASMVAMSTLGLCAKEPCSPFTGSPGLTVGEGAAFLVLESFESAEQRGARILGELLGHGVSADAYDAFANDPAGGGLHRALGAALRGSGVDPAQVGWIRASGTGHPDQDQAETRVIKQVFGAAAPPVVSLEPALGHANGAAPAIALAVALECQRAGLIPPTLNGGAPRPGCDLDYVTDGPRRSEAPCFVSNTLAFGGLNAVITASSSPGSAPSTHHDGLEEPIVITGIGLVSPVGFGLGAFAEALRQGRSGIRDIDRFPVQDGGARRAGLVTEVPTTGLRGGRRQDRLRQYAQSALGAALRDADPGMRTLAEERLGLLLTLSRAPVTAYERFFERLPKGDPLQASTGRAVLEMGAFSVVSQLCSLFKARGYGAVMAEGITGGLHALVHGHELLRHDSSQDAIVVIAADELGALFHRLYGHLGLLSRDARGGEALRPYDPDANGMVLGEGAVAIVLERLSSARARGARPRALVAGTGLTSDARGYLRVDPRGEHLEHAMRQALEEARTPIDSLDLVYGHGRGLPVHDGRELHAFERLLSGRSVPIGCVMGHTGVAESSCGLFSVAAAMLSLRHGEAWPVLSHGTLPGRIPFVRGAPLHRSFRNALVCGSTDSGSNAALVLTPPPVS